MPTRAATRFTPHRSRRLRDKNRRGVEATRTEDSDGRRLFYADFDGDPSTPPQVCRLCPCARVRSARGTCSPPSCTHGKCRSARHGPANSVLPPWPSFSQPAALCQESIPQENLPDGSSLLVTAIFPFEVSSEGAPARLSLLGLRHNACRRCRWRMFAVNILTRPRQNGRFRCDATDKRAHAQT